MSLKESSVYKDMTKDELLYEISKRNAKNPYEAAEAGVIGAVAPKAPAEELTQIPPPLKEGEQLMPMQPPKSFNAPGGSGQDMLTMSTSAWKSFMDVLQKPQANMSMTEAIQKGAETVGGAASKAASKPELQGPIGVSGSVGAQAGKQSVSDMASGGGLAKAGADVTTGILEALKGVFSKKAAELPARDVFAFADGLEKKQKLDSISMSREAQDVFERTGDMNLAAQVAHAGIGVSKLGGESVQRMTQSPQAPQPSGPGTFQSDVAGKAPMTDTTGQMSDGIPESVRQTDAYYDSKRPKAPGAFKTWLAGHGINTPEFEEAMKYAGARGAGYGAGGPIQAERVLSATHTPQTKQEIAQMSLDAVTKSLDANLKQGQDIQGMFEQSWNRKNIGQKWVGGWSATEREKLLPAYLDNLNERSDLIKAMMEKSGKSSPTAAAKKGVIDPETKKRIQEIDAMIERKKGQRK